MKKTNPRKVAAKEEKRRKWRRAVEIVREATRKALAKRESEAMRG